MNEQVKQKWLSALRSGHYKQTQNYLHKEDGFCCLGVLCDLYGKEHNVEWNLANSGINYEFQDEPECLPPSVVEWAGVVGTDPVIGDGKAYLSLLNDTGYTFNEIADLIQEHL